MEIVERLREEREALVARLAKIDKILDQYEEWGRMAQSVLSHPTTISTNTPLTHRRPDVALQADTPDSHATVSEPSKKIGGIPKRTSWSNTPTLKTPMAEFEAAVIDVLRFAQKPMDRTELYDSLTERGIVIGSGGRDRDLNALSARVYRMAQDPRNNIKGERGLGYWIDEEISGENEDTVEGDEATNGSVFS